MALLPILEAPHPILSKKARLVAENEFGEDLVQLLNDMAETMYDAPGVGLAAPQIGDSRRILVPDPSNNDETRVRRWFEIIASLRAVDRRADQSAAGPRRGARGAAGRAHGAHRRDATAGGGDGAAGLDRAAQVAGPDVLVPAGRVPGALGAVAELLTLLYK